MLPELWQRKVPAAGPGPVQDLVLSTVSVPGLRVLVQEPDQSQSGDGIIGGDLTEEKTWKQLSPLGRIRKRSESRGLRSSPL